MNSFQYDTSSPQSLAHIKCSCGMLSWLGFSPGVALGNSFRRSSWLQRVPARFMPLVAPRSKGGPVRNSLRKSSGASRTTPRPWPFSFQHGGFLSHRGTPKSSNSNGIFYYKPSSYGVPPFMETPTCLLANVIHKLELPGPSCSYQC